MAAATLHQVVADENKYVLQTYGRPNDLVFTHGEGVKLFSADGREFLDFAAGIAVNSIGHGHPHWVKAVQEQVLALTLLDHSAGSCTPPHPLFSTLVQSCSGLAA